MVDKSWNRRIKWVAGNCRYLR